MTQELIAEAVLGKDAEEFLASELGRYIIGCADQEIHEAVEELKRVPSTNRERIDALQNQVWRAESLKTWLVSLVSNGKQALDALEDR